MNRLRPMKTNVTRKGDCEIAMLHRNSLKLISSRICEQQHDVMLRKQETDSLSRKWPYIVHNLMLFNGKLSFASQH